MDEIKELSLEEKHKLMLYPMVRVTSGKAMGSGTVIYSKPKDGNKDSYSTYILTNEHVVDDLIKVEEKWSSLLRRTRKVDVLGTPKVEFFHYEYSSRVVGGTTMTTEIVAYDKDEDELRLLSRDRKGEDKDSEEESFTD